MESRVFSYESDEVEITWDKKRCIHAEECVKGMPQVFDITRKPWIDPDSADNPGMLKQVIEKCPSGALHYHFKNMEEVEQPPANNVVTIDKDGPVYVHGDIRVVDMDDKELFNDTRLAFCRCGASSNKPLCDNSHKNIEFSAPAVYNPERLLTEPSSSDGGKLNVKLVPNGPFVIEGSYEVKGEKESSTKTEKKMSFCRCGGSSNKPFCDGSHKDISFKA